MLNQINSNILLVKINYLLLYLLLTFILAFFILLLVFIIKHISYLYS